MIIIIKILKHTCFQLINLLRVTGLACQNAIVHAQTFQRLSVQNNALVAMLLMSLESGN